MLCLANLFSKQWVSNERMIGASLEKAGFEVTRTINGRIAWDQLMAWKEAATREDRPITDFVHILVSDIEMPAMEWPWPE